MGNHAVRMTSPTQQIHENIKRPSKQKIFRMLMQAKGQGDELMNKTVKKQ
jgi:hypothetical protein